MQGAGAEAAGVHDELDGSPQNRESEGGSGDGPANMEMFEGAGQGPDALCGFAVGVDIADALYAAVWEGFGVEDLEALRVPGFDPLAQLRARAAGGGDVEGGGRPWGVGQQVGEPCARRARGSRAMGRARSGG